MRNSGKPISSYSPAIQAQIMGQLVRAVAKIPAKKMFDCIDRKAVATTMLFNSLGLPVPTRELRFAAPRRWRFDFAWPEQKVALEVEGGVWTGGRHTRGKGFLGDMEKYNRAVVLGWRVVRCTPDKLTSAVTIEMLRALLK